MMKKLLIGFLIVSMMVFNTINCFAVSNEYEPPDVLSDEQYLEMYNNQGDNYFHFFNESSDNVPSPRFTSKGGFDFKFANSLKSGSFKLTTNSTTISCDSKWTAGKECTGFNIKLYEKSALTWTSQGYKTYTLGKSNKTWSSIFHSPVSSYYIEMYSKDGESGSTIEGSGTISNFSS